MNYRLAEQHQGPLANLGAVHIRTNLVPQFSACCNRSTANHHLFREFDMITKEGQSNLLCQIAVLRQQRSADADESIGKLLDSVDLYVWHTDNWLKEPEVAERLTAKLLDCPQACIELSLWALLNLALEGLTTAAECLRAGIAYPGAWLLRNLLEARTNAIFMAYEPTGLAGQRWIDYNAHREARLDEDSTPAKKLIDEIKSRYPDDNINRDGWWAKTTDPDGTSKLLLNLIDRAQYVEKLQTPKEDFMTALRRASHQHELDLVRKANLSVHPMLTGPATTLHPIQVLYWGSQATWDILKAHSARLVLSPSHHIIQAHEQLEITAIEVGSAQVAPDQ